MVDQNRASWNQIGVFLMKIEGLRSAQLTA
jgi:hypothetical protein